MKLLSRLLSPRTLLGVAAIVLGAQIGLGIALNGYKSELQRRSTLTPEDWERVTGMVYGLVPTMTFCTVGAFLLVALLPIERGDRHRIELLARRKLSESVLSEAEAEVWTAVLQEVKHRDSVD